MKLFVVACLLAAAAAAPSSPAETAAAPGSPAETATRRALPALVHEEIHDEFGQYALRYVTAEGTVVSEQGHLVPNPDGKTYVLVKEGETSFIGEDGKTYVTKYSSGLDGLRRTTRVEGAHLPVQNAMA